MVKKAPIPCTKEEMNRIIEAAAENEFYYTLFSVAKTTGRRLGEYWHVKVKDIDFDRNIMMTIVLKRRARVQREAILSDETSKLLKIYIARHSLKSEDYIFRKVTYRSIQYAVSRYAQLAGINHKVSFHNFRHYFVTELIKQNWHYDQIAKLTGHGSSSTLVHYDHAVASDIKEAALKALKAL